MKTPDRLKYNCGHNPDGYCQLCLKPLIDRQERSQAPQLTKEKIEEIAVKTFHELWDKLPKLKGEELKRKMKEMGFVPVSHPSRPDERDELILKMREHIKLQEEHDSCADDNSKCEFDHRIITAETERLLALPIPASTKRYELMVKVVDDARLLADANSCADSDCCETNLDELKKRNCLKSSLASLDSLGAEEGK